MDFPLQLALFVEALQCRLYADLVNGSGRVATCQGAVLWVPCSRWLHMLGPVPRVSTKVWASQHVGECAQTSQGIWACSRLWCYALEVQYRLNSGYLMSCWVPQFS